MSNVIKGNAVRYNNEEKFKIDFNAKSEELLNQFLLDHPRLNNSSIQNDDFEDNFVAGINAVRLNASLEDHETAKGQPEQSSIQGEAAKAYIENMYQEAEEKIQEMLDDAGGEAESIIKNAKTQAQAEKKAVFKKAEEDGYKEGIKKSEKEINAMKALLEQEKQEFYAERERMLKEIEPQMVSLIISLLYKLTGVLLEDRREIIFYLVQQALYGAEASSTYIIRSSKADHAYLLSRKEELLGLVKAGTELEIIEDVLLGRSQCLIDADSRVIDISLDVQLSNLIESLKMLAL